MQTSLLRYCQNGMSSDLLLCRSFVPVGAHASWWCLLVCCLVNPGMFSDSFCVGCSPWLMHMPADGIYWCTGWVIQECLLICYYVGRSSLLVHIPADGVYWRADWLIQGCLLICYYFGLPSLLVHIPVDGVYWCTAWLIQGCFLNRSVLVIYPCWFTCQLMVFTDVLVGLSRDIFWSVIMLVVDANASWWYLLVCWLVNLGMPSDLFLCAHASWWRCWWAVSVSPGMCSDLHGLSL